MFLLLFNGCEAQIEEKEGISGVWLTNVDSDALNSKENIKRNCRNL
jgi:uncharacterized lipoprotein YddW (UPF0748 family)